AGRKMTKKGKDCLIGFLFVISMIVLFTLLTFNEPFEIHKQRKEPSPGEKYQELLKERIDRELEMIVPSR
ncbi:unnamed protein product, partial [marine sediment metagenome]